MCDIDGEPPSVWREVWRRARKEHTCCACDETIRPGDLYHFIAACWDGSWSTLKHCARCWRMYRHLCEVSDEPGSVALQLDCGYEYEAPADHPAHRMAFMTREEAQRFAEREKRRDDQWGPMGLVDQLEGRAQYYAKYGNPIDNRRKLREEREKMRKMSYPELVNYASQPRTD